MTSAGRCAHLRALPVEQHVRELVIGHTKSGLQRFTTATPMWTRSGRRSNFGRHGCATS